MLSITALSSSLSWAWSPQALSSVSVLLSSLALRLYRPPAAVRKASRATARAQERAAAAAVSASPAHSIAVVRQTNPLEDAEVRLLPSEHMGASLSLVCSLSSFRDEVLTSCLL